MTSVYEHVTRIRRIGEERRQMQQMPEGPARDAAAVHLAVLEHIRACQATRDSGLSRQCNELNAEGYDPFRRRRPYLTWNCCAVHRNLREQRESLTKQAAALGIELNLDMTQVIEG